MTPKGSTLLQMPPLIAVKLIALVSAISLQLPFAPDDLLDGGSGGCVFFCSVRLKSYVAIKRQL